MTVAPSSRLLQLFVEIRPDTSLVGCVCSIAGEEVQVVRRRAPLSGILCRNTIGLVVVFARTIVGVLFTESSGDITIIRHLHLALLGFLSSNDDDTISSLGTIDGC